MVLRCSRCSEICLRRCNVLHIIKPFFNSIHQEMRPFLYKDSFFIFSCETRQEGRADLGRRGAAGLTFFTLNVNFISICHKFFWVLQYAPEADSLRLTGWLKSQYKDVVTFLYNAKLDVCQECTQVFECW